MKLCWHLRLYGASHWWKFDFWYLGLTGSDAGEIVTADAWDFTDPAADEILTANTGVFAIGLGQPLTKLWLLVHETYSTESAADETLTVDAWDFTELEADETLLILETLRSQLPMKLWLLILESYGVSRRWNRDCWYLRLDGVSRWWNFDCWYLRLYSMESVAGKTLTANSGVFIIGSQPMMKLCLLILATLL